MSDKLREELANADISTDNLKFFLGRGWTDLQSYLDSLSEEQMTVPKDAGGWSVKDHMVNLVMWEQGLVALLNGGSQQGGMDIDDEPWAKGTDAINAVIQKRYDDKSVTEVRQMFQEAHDCLLAKIDTMTDADLIKPYSEYDATSNEEDEIIGWIVGNSFGHYDEHMPWINAIIDQYGT